MGAGAATQERLVMRIRLIVPPSFVVLSFAPLSVFDAANLVLERPFYEVHALSMAGVHIGSGKSVAARRRGSCGLASVLALACFLGACAPSTQHAPSPPVHPTAFIQVGMASWYGEAHAGRHTASGEPFDPNAMTAAHRTLPLGARVRVTNIENGRTITVKINDRGPANEGRIIDLSRAAADALGFRASGTARVRLEGL